MSQTSAGVVSLRVAAIRNLVWSALERWGGQLLGIVIFTLLARVLDRPIFGIMALANVYLGFIQIFVTQGVGVALIQRRDLTPAHLDTAFWLNAAAALILSAVTIVFRADIAMLLGSADVAPVLPWLALTLPLLALSVVPAAVLQRELRFKRLAGRSLVSALIAGLVGIAAALLGLGLWSLVLQQITGAVLSTVLLWTSVSWRPRWSCSKRALADLAPISSSMLVNDVLWAASQRVDQAVVGRSFGVEALGGYYLALRVVNMGVEFITGPTQAVAMPLFSGIQHHPERLGRTFLRSTSLVCSVAFPLFLGLMLVAPRFVPLLFGSKWNDAVLPLQILCGAGCVRAALTFVHPTMIALGRPGIYTALFTSHAVLSAVFCVLALPYGIAAVAYAVVISVTLTAIADLVVLQRLLQFRPSDLWSTLGPILLSCGLVVVAVVAVDRTVGERVPAVGAVALQVASGVMVYVASVAIFAKSTWMELRSTTRLIIGQGA